MLARSTFAVLQMAQRGVVFWMGFTVVAILAMAAGTWLFFTPTLRPYLDFVGYILTVSGFFIVWYQIRKVRGAAEAARDAAKGAIDSLSERLTIADLSRMEAKFHRAQDSIRGGKLDVAQYVLRDLRNEVAQLRFRRGFGAEDRQAAITGIIASLRKSLDVVERTIVDPATPMPPRMLTSLGEHAVTLIEWGEALQFNPVGEA